jgi:hypothetical protein
VRDTFSCFTQFIQNRFNGSCFFECYLKSDSFLIQTATGMHARKEEANSNTLCPLHSVLKMFTFGCCILLRIYPTGSLLFRQSQQSFNKSLPLFIFLHSLHVSAPTGHLQVRYTIRCFQGLFLLQRIRCTYTT